jgi:hypothetical protein
MAAFSIVGLLPIHLFVVDNSLASMKELITSICPHSAASLVPRFRFPPAAFASTGARNFPV